MLSTSTADCRLNGVGSAVKRRYSELLADNSGGGLTSGCPLDTMTRPYKRMSPFHNTPIQRKEAKRRILKISLKKMNSISCPETFLRRSVLINNLARSLQDDLKDDRLWDRWDWECDLDMFPSRTPPPPSAHAGMPHGVPSPHCNKHLGYDVTGGTDVITNNSTNSTCTLLTNNACTSSSTSSSHTSHWTLSTHTNWVNAGVDDDSQLSPSERERATRDLSQQHDKLAQSLDQLTSSFDMDFAHHPTTPATSAPCAVNNKTVSSFGGLRMGTRDSMLGHCGNDSGKTSSVICNGGYSSCANDLTVSAANGLMNGGSGGCSGVGSHSALSSNFMRLTDHQHCHQQPQHHQPDNLPHALPLSCKLSTVPSQGHMSPAQSPVDPSSCCSPLFGPASGLSDTLLTSSNCATPSQPSLPSTVGNCCYGQRAPPYVDHPNLSAPLSPSCGQPSSYSTSTSAASKSSGVNSSEISSNDQLSSTFGSVSSSSSSLSQHHQDINVTLDTSCTSVGHHHGHWPRDTGATNSNCALSASLAGPSISSTDQSECGLATSSYQSEPEEEESESCSTYMDLTNGFFSNVANCSSNKTSSTNVIVTNSSASQVSGGTDLWDLCPCGSRSGSGGGGEGLHPVPSGSFSSSHSNCCVSQTSTTSLCASVCSVGALTNNNNVDSCNNNGSKLLKSSLSQPPHSHHPHQRHYQHHQGSCSHITSVSSSSTSNHQHCHQQQPEQQQYHHNATSTDSLISGGTDLWDIESNCPLDPVLPDGCDGFPSALTAMSCQGSPSPSTVSQPAASPGPTVSCSTEADLSERGLSPGPGSVVPPFLSEQEKYMTPGLRDFDVIYNNLVSVLIGGN